MNRFVVFFLALCFLSGTAYAQQAQQTYEPLDKKWLALFEQTFGDEGLYVVEVSPKDPAGPVRLALQAMNSAAHAELRKNPEAHFTLATVRALPAMQGVEIPAGASISWNAEAKLFEGAGDAEKPLYGALQLLRQYESAAIRLMRPDRYTRDRWKRIYQDKESPQLLKQEILFREFIQDHYYFREALELEAIQRNLVEIDRAVAVYALAMQLQEGDTIYLPDLELEGLLPSRLPGPTDVRYTMSKVGEKPSAKRGEQVIEFDPQAPVRLREARAKRAVEAYPDFPPAIALASRFDRPTAALLKVNRAIDLWPDVPSLRVERLAVQARARNFEAWTRDLDYIVQRFPAAPILEEIKLAGAAGGIDAVPPLRAQIATLIADVRPDLLGPQLEAIESLERAGQVDAALTVYERLAFANPALASLLQRPGS